MMLPISILSQGLETKGWSAAPKVWGKPTLISAIILRHDGALGVASHMPFLPPGTSRLIRVHGAFVTEAEINRVVDFWKEQARPEDDQTFLITPPAEAAGDA